MRANKKTLLAVKSFLENREGWDLGELTNKIVEQTNLLKNKEMGEVTLSTDECGIEWDGEEVCVLAEFLDSYSEVFIEKICNILDSFIGEDINCYLGEE